MFRLIAIFCVLIIFFEINLAKKSQKKSNDTTIKEDGVPMFGNSSFDDRDYEDAYWNDWLDEMEEYSIRSHYFNKSIVYGNGDDVSYTKDDIHILGNDGFGKWEFRTDKGERGTVTKNNIHQHKKKFFFLPTPGEGRCPNCKCGVRFYRRVVGGQLAERNEFPWIGLLRLSGRFLCGSSLISNRHVLTAAHCIYGVKAKDLSVIFRVYNRLKPIDLPEFARRVSVVYRLKNYNPTTYNKDIAIIRLSSRVPVGISGLTTVCLPGPKLITANHYGLAAGWGALTEGGNSAKRLHKVVLQILSSRSCRNTKYGDTEITKYMICGGYKAGGKDTCQGDSGGPLMVFVNGRLVQVGITSFGEGCARPGYPGVYTKVKLFMRFIRNIIGDACTCHF